MASTTAAPVAAASSTLEDLAFASGTDKSRDDHGYVAVYEMLFDTRREQLANVTEVGIMRGDSLRIWPQYFVNAHVYAVDLWPAHVERSQRWAAEHCRSRCHVLWADSQNQTSIDESGLSPSSMDLVIDDGDHSPEGTLRTLQIMWPLVRPGGYYVIEDVATGADAKGMYREAGEHRAPPGFAFLAHNRSAWPSFLRTIYRENDVFFCDTQVGARNFAKYHYLMGNWMRDTVDHNSHLMVIRRRREPRRRSEQIHYHPTHKPKGGWAGWARSALPVFAGT